MIIEGEFFSGGHLRWNLGWPTPNYAGAFLVTLLAWAFFFSASRWRWAWLGVELGGLFLLAKTYSRGAAVAWGLAWLCAVVALRVWRDPAQRLVWAARAVALGAIMLAVGFDWSRAAENGRTAGDSVPAGPVAETGKGEGAPEDGSVVNRLALWQGGLKMIAAAPWRGWGAGESGRAYMNWFQDLEREEGYTSMVNSYLHVAVEHGLPWLVLVVFGLTWLLAVGWRTARDASIVPGRRALAAAAGASLVGWAAANVFTTLWIEPRLWLMPAAAAFVLGWGAGKNNSLRLGPLTAASLVWAMLVAGGLYGAGRWLQGSPAFAIVPGANDTVVLTPAGPVGQAWHVWPDPSVLGSVPGKELRRWAEQSSSIRLVAHRAIPVSPQQIPAKADGVMLFGRQAGRIGREDLPAAPEWWIVHPSVPPPSPEKQSGLIARRVTVLLPQVDEAGNAPAWRRWAGQHGARVVESPGSGLDIRNAWPAIVNLEKKGAEN